MSYGGFKKRFGIKEENLTYREAFLITDTENNFENGIVKEFCNRKFDNIYSPLFEIKNKRESLKNDKGLIGKLRSYYQSRLFELQNKEFLDK